MKKIIICSVISILMLFSLCACGAKGNTKCSPDLVTPFSIKAEIEYDEMKAEAVFTKYENTDWDVEFSAPDTLSGVLLAFRGNNVEASYKGLSFSVPKSALPLKSMIAAFIQATDELAKMPEITGDTKDNEIITEGETELGKYTVKFSNDNILSGFEMENLNLVIKFSEYTKTGMTAPTEASEPTEAETTPTETELTLQTETSQNEE